jgi:phospholipid/cholesterol/gamma-HCH transport system substrate-binding protein
VQQVIKETPSLGRLAAMVVFTLSCFGLLMFLWLAFGGPTPLQPQSFRFKVAVPEAATLAQEADVRLAGVNIGKVKTKELADRGARTLVEVELKDEFAPIPKDTRAIVRQKTLLGESYLQLSSGHRRSGPLEDGGRLPDAQVEPTVELDEIFSAFDEPTREAFREWFTELAKAIRGGRSESLSDAFGNLEGFAVDGSKLLEVLDEQELAVRRLIKNTGVVFGAINERQGALRELIQNAGDTFRATASRDEALAETFHVFPTFLDESRATLARLETFARDTRPLVNRLKVPADDLAPTLRDLGDLAPDLKRLFRDLDPLIAASRRGVPALERFLRAAEPVLEGLDVFLDELNPILSYANFHQETVAGFLNSAGPDLIGEWAGGQRGQTQVGIIDPRSFPSPEFPTGYQERPFFERGNAYLEPNALLRAVALGTIESFDCAPAGDERRDPEDATDPGESAADKAPPCFVQPPSLYTGKRFTPLARGQAPKVDPPRGFDGRAPADPNR